MRKLYKFCLKYKNSIILSFILLLEFALFRTCVQRDIIGSCPRNIDQAVFMRMTYHMYENIVSGNWGEVLHEISTGLGQGAFPVFGLIFLFIFGKSRLSLLLVNFTLFVLVQGVGYHYVKKMSNSNTLGYVFLGLFLMIQSPYFEAGGLFDYRMDFSAFCLYTCWMVTFVAAHYINDKKTYYLSAAFCGMTLMFRSNTLAYLGIAFFLFECIYLFVLKQENLKEELVKLIKYACIIVVFGGWYIVAQSKALLQYYLTAHVTSDEPQIRMLEQGIKNTSDYLLFYPKSLVNTHLGKMLSGVLAILILISLILYLVNKKKKDLKIDKNEKTAFVAGMCGFVSPFIVLTIDISKSAVVICTVAGVSVIISLFFVIILVNKNLLAKFVPYICAGVFICLGLFNYIDNTTQTLVGYSQKTQNEMIDINQCMEEYLVENDLKSAKLLVDRICDAITTDVITVLTYEMDNVYVDMGYAWNTINTYQDYSSEEVDAALSEADLMVLSKSVYTTNSYYPTDASFDRYREYMLEYAYNHLIELGEYNLGGDILIVFGKGQAKVSSTWSDWMSDRGNSVTFCKQNEKQKEIVIEGNLGGGFNSVEEFQPIVLLDGLEIPSIVTVSDGRYTITIDISALAVASYKLELTFNNAFIPSELGINEDNRRLVVMSPNKVGIK